MILDIVKLKRHIEQSGIKQKFISEKTSIPEPTLSLILNGKRKCEVGEYASICNTLGVGFEMFVSSTESETEKEETRV